jgi:hypothetical protein
LVSFDSNPHMTERGVACLMDTIGNDHYGSVAARFGRRGGDRSLGLVALKTHQRGHGAAAITASIGLHDRVVQSL